VDRYVLALLLSASALQGRALGQELSAAVASTGDTASAVRSSPHVRIDDKRLQNVLTQAARASPTLQSLIARLEDSDVVAYVQYDPQPRSRASGHLSFLSSVAGVRYVIIRVAFVGKASSQAAIIGHELRHAVEVVEHAAIIDVASFDREYARIGFRSTSRREHAANAYETDAARRAGEQVLRELHHETD
jgi:hypothetical protein